MSSPAQITDSEVQIESSFRQLQTAVHSERQKLRDSWVDIEKERTDTASKLQHLRQETEQWCSSERSKIEDEWKRVDKLRERMSIVWNDEDTILEINCSGSFFSLPKSALTFVKGSHLNHMFSDAFIQSIPRDGDGRYFFDFNPICFGFVMKYLQACMERQDAAPPPVPPEQQQNMDVLAETLRLKAFFPINRLNPVHHTSLKLSGGPDGRCGIEASHTGWQVIAAAHPISMASSSYFEVHIGANNEARGGLAVGLCGHMPQGAEIHNIRMTDSVLYNSGIGLIGDAFAAENVTKAIVLTEGSTIGVKYDPQLRRFEWFHNRATIGTATMKPQSQEKMLQIYPVVALGEKGQKVQVDFAASIPTPQELREQRLRGY